MARGHPLLLLALFVSAESVALQHSGSEDDGAWSFWQNPGHEKRALLVIQGLLRSVKNFWPKVEQNFVAPNAAAGYNFTVVLHTSLTASCSRKHREAGRQDWCNQIQNEYGSNPKERRASLEKLFAGHDFVLADTEDRCYTDGGDPWRVTTEYLKGPWRSAECSGTIHMSSRSTQALDSFKGKKGYNRVVIIRTDNCFELQGHAKEDKPVLLDTACGNHPGAGIIGNLNDVRIPYGHDYDHAWMLCDGSRAHVFRESIAAFGMTCQDCFRLPKCPGTFCQGRMQCGSNLCESAAILERGGVSFGTLDDYMVANYKVTNSTSGDIELRNEERWDEE